MSSVSFSVAVFSLSSRAIHPSYTKSTTGPLATEVAMVSAVPPLSPGIVAEVPCSLELLAGRSVVRTQGREN